MKQSLSDLIKEMHDAAISTLASRQSWKNYLDKGGGENNVAGNHQGRYLLELLQNARDAAKDSESGRVLVVVTEQAVHVANSGQPFQVDDLKVLDAVCHLSRSTKVGNAGFIGHKGIGLKSILLQASSFTITTQLTEGPVSLDFSRSKTAEVLGEKLNGNPDSSKAKENGGIPEGDFFAGLPRLPLFGLPHQVPSEIGASLFSLAGINIDGQSKPMEDLREKEQDYKTVVSLFFDDHKWKKQLDSARQFLVEHNLEDHLTDFDNSLKTFEQLKTGSGADKAWGDIRNIKPEALILMGKLDQATFIRQGLTGTIIAWRRITIKRDNGLENPLVRLVTYTDDEMGNSPVEHQYILIEQDIPEDETEAPHASLLIHIPSSDEDFKYISQPLYMYYPISSQQSGLPFFLHGNFQVNPDRTQLWEVSEKHNTQVIESAVDLLKSALPFLAKEKHLHGWLPWLLLPLKLERETDAFTYIITSQFREMLRNQAWVPTTAGLKKPSGVHFLPHYPWALRLFLYTAKEMQRFAILEDENLKHYDPQREPTPNGRLSFPLCAPAVQIGLGGFALDHTNYWAQLNDFYNLLAEFGQTVYASHVSEDSKDLLLVNDAQAVYDTQDFFRAICDLLIQTSTKEKARLLGENNVPLLPTSIDGNTYLVSAWNEKASGDQQDEHKKRVVFYPPYPEKAQDIPQLPSRLIPAYKIPEALKDLSTKISSFEKDWKVYPYSTIDDEFRRISERLDDLDQFSPELLGYLAGLLWKINPGEENYLYPRPYSHIDLELLKKALKNDQVKREDLLREQGWRQVHVPTKNGQEHAGEVIFGSEWADLLENTEYSAWVELIRKNLLLDPLALQVCSPDDLRWDEALRVIRSFGKDISENEPRRILFNLLLLLGVRLGPKVEWRWLDLQARGDTNGLDNQLSKNQYEPGTGSPKISIFPNDLAFSSLYDSYRKWIRAGKNSAGMTIDFGQYGWKHEASINIGDPLQNEYLAAIIWLPNLTDAIDQSPDFLERADFFTNWYIAWINNTFCRNRILNTGWYSNWYNNNLIWNSPIPSLVSYQVIHLHLWKASPPFDLAKRYPAYAMIPQTETPAVSDNAGSVLGFPCIDFNNVNIQKIIEKSLGIGEIKNMDAFSAIGHLRWLLEQWREGDLDLNGGWRLKTPNNYDKWLDLIYSLLERIAGNQKDPQWIPFLYKTCGLVVPAVKVKTERILVAVPYKDKGWLQSLQYFDHAPHNWEIKQLGEKDFIFMADDRTLRETLLPWARKAKMANAKRERKTILQSQFIHDEQSKQELAEAKDAVIERLYLLIGFLSKSQRNVDNLRKRYQDILGALDQMQVVENSLMDQLLGEGNILLLSRADKRKWKVPVCLAHGLVVFLKVEADQLANFTLALSMPLDQVELILSAQDIDMDAICKDLPELEAQKASAKASRMRDQGNKLLLLLGQQPMDGYDRLTEDNKVIELLLEQTGLSEILLRQILNSDTQSEDRDLILARQLYDGVQHLGQSDNQLLELFKFAFPGLVKQIEQQESVVNFLNWLAAARWLSELESGEMTSDWQAQIRKIRDSLQLHSLYKEDLRSLVKSGIDSIIPLEVNSPSNLLVVWGNSDWEMLSAKLEGIVNDRLAEEKFYDPGQLIDCLKNGTLPEIPQQPPGPKPLPNLDKTQLLSDFDNNQLFLSWPAEYKPGLKQSEQAEISPSINGIGNPIGFGGKPRLVTLNMQMQGEIAELFVIEEIWQRFLKQTPERRVAILDRLIKFRSDQKCDWLKLTKELDAKKQELADTPGAGQMKSLFRRAIDLSDVGLAGFDIIDPFGGLKFENTESPNPCLVEVKSILDLDKPRIVMTSHEYKVAKANQDIYKLRIVFVPSEGMRSDPTEYHMVDFSDLFTALKLDSWLCSTIRHGKFDVTLPTLLIE